MRTDCQSSALHLLLDITERAVEASTDRLEHREFVVVTIFASIVWIPARRLNWLRTRADAAPGTKKEIASLTRGTTENGKWKS